MHLTRTSTLSTVAIAATLVLSACSSDPEPTQTNSESSEESTAVADFNDADVAFVTGMIPHHQQAVSMSQMAEDRAGSDVSALATQIESAQEPEIERMTQWLDDWGQATPSSMGDMGDMGDMDMGDMGDMDGMMSMEDMQALQDADGEQASRLYLEQMIAHHEGAITMSLTYQDEGMNDEALDLAQTIIDAQKEEIATMEDILGTL